MKAHQTFFMDCHLAGRKYYDADLVWDYLRVGQSLRLERDMQNPHDPNAVQVIYNKDGENYLLGFIPRSDNQQLAAFLEMGWTAQREHGHLARITLSYHEQSTTNHPLILLAFDGVWLSDPRCRDRLLCFYSFY